MAKIAFMIDIEEGHLLPTFSFARSLVTTGHEIVYMAFPDSEELILKAGFSYYPLFDKYYPRGFKDEYKRISMDDEHRGFDRHFNDFVNGAFHRTLVDVDADAFVVSCFFSIEMLFMYYSFGLKPIILSPRLYGPHANLCDMCVAEIFSLPAEASVLLLDAVRKNNPVCSSFRDIVAPISGFIHFVLCSREFEIDSCISNQNTFFIGSGCCAIGYTDFVPEVPDGAKVIYASMGSQSHAYGAKSRTLLLKLLNLMKNDELSGFQLVFSTGGNDAMLHGLEIDMPNVRVVEWVDQRLVLQNSTVAFVHGGLNSVKECIYAGVPMIVVPGSRDQPLNAERVVTRKLGIAIDIESISEDDLMAVVFRILNDSSFKSNVLGMRDKFVELDNMELGVSILDKLVRIKGSN